jgi:hypothetical protein
MYRMGRRSGLTHHGGRHCRPLRSHSSLPFLHLPPTSTDWIRLAWQLGARCKLSWKPPAPAASILSRVIPHAAQRAYPQSLSRRSTRRTRAPPPYGTPIAHSAPLRRAPGPRRRMRLPRRSTSSASPSTPRTMTVLMLLLFSFSQIIHST